MVVERKVNWLKPLILAFALLIIPWSAQADQLILKNGDRLSGTVV